MSENFVINQKRSCSKPFTGQVFDREIHSHDTDLIILITCIYIFILGRRRFFFLRVSEGGENEEDYLLRQVLIPDIINGIDGICCYRFTKRYTISKVCDVL